MTAVLHNTPYAAASVTALSSASGYPPGNVTVPGVMRGWRSSGTGVQWLQIDLGLSRSVTAIAITEAMPESLLASGITVLADNNTVPTTNRGTMTMGRDDNGRIKGSLPFSLLFPPSFRYLRLQLTGSASPYAIGSVFVFGATLMLAVDPLFGSTRLSMIDPQARVDLPNGVTESYLAGASSTEIELGFRARATHDITAVRRLARASPCWLDFATSERGRQWPVRYHEPQVQRSLEGFNRESVAIKLREIV